MKLEINLDDREEISAAVLLLQLILDGTTKPQSATPLPVIAPPPAAATALPTAPVAPPVSLTVPPAPSLPAPPGPATVAQQAALPVLTADYAQPVELDSTGLPWDERIHSSAKTRNGNGAGTWKAKRNVDAALVAQVEAELRAVAALNTAFPAGIAAPPAPDASDAAAIFAGGPDPVAAFGGGAVAPAPLPIVPPAAPSMPAAPAAPAAPSASADPATFEQLMLRVSPAVAGGTLPPQALQAACTAMGLASIAALLQQPAMVPMVWATLKQQAPAL